MLSRQTLLLKNTGSLAEALVCDRFRWDARARTTLRFMKMLHGFYSSPTCLLQRVIKGGIILRLYRSPWFASTADLKGRETCKATSAIF